MDDAGTTRITIGELWRRTDPGLAERMRPDLPDDPSPEQVVLAAARGHQRLVRPLRDGAGVGVVPGSPPLPGMTGSTATPRSWHPAVHAAPQVPRPGGERSGPVVVAPLVLMAPRRCHDVVGGPVDAHRPADGAGLPDQRSAGLSLIHISEPTRPY